MIIPERRTDPGRPHWTCDGCGQESRDDGRVCSNSKCCTALLCGDAVHECADCGEVFCPQHLRDSARHLDVVCAECQIVRDGAQGLARRVAARPLSTEMSGHEELSAAELRNTLDGLIREARLIVEGGA